MHCGSPGSMLKNIIFSICYDFLLAWHSRGRGFDSLQLHQEECQGVTEKSVTPFSLPWRQRAPTLPVGYGVAKRKF
jgi:hypothetical protein